MKLVALSTIFGLLVLPVSALALSTSPATPGTITESGSHRCTTLSFSTTAPVNAYVVLRIFNAHGKGAQFPSGRAWSRHGLRAGRHDYRFCGYYVTYAATHRYYRPGTWHWGVQTRHLKGDPLSKMTPLRKIVILP